MTSRTILVSALAIGASLALFAGCGDDDADAPAADGIRTAESDARSIAEDDAVDQGTSADADIGFVGGGSCSAPWTLPGTAPDGVMIEGWASASFENKDDEPVVIAALSGEIGVEQSAIDCFFGEGDDVIAEDGAGTGPAEDADRAASSPPAPGSADEATPEGFGWCGVNWQPELGAGALPEGARIDLNANASFGPERLLAPARSALAEASGQPAASIECSHEIPPVGECFVELGAGADGLPDGARVEGNVFGTYIRVGDKARVRAAVAALGGVAESRVRCMDFPDEPGILDEPVPVEPGGAPATSGPQPDAE